MATALLKSALAHAAVLPLIVLAPFLGVMWLIGLCCDKDRRKYVTDVSTHVMAAIGGSQAPDVTNSTECRAAAHPEISRPSNSARRLPAKSRVHRARRGRAAPNRYAG